MIHNITWLKLVTTGPHKELLFIWTDYGKIQNRDSATALSSLSMMHIRKAETARGARPAPNTTIWSGEDKSALSQSLYESCKQDVKKVPLNRIEINGKNLFWLFSHHLGINDFVRNHPFSSILD